MLQRLSARWETLSLAQHFMIVSFVVLLFGMLGVGWWVSAQIERGVIERTADTSALYVVSLVSPSLREMAVSGVLSDSDRAALDQLFKATPLGQEIEVFKLWDIRGQILYSTQPVLEGQVFPVDGGLAQAWAGQVASAVDDLEEEENVLERAPGKRLLEVYSPVRLHSDGPVLAVAEFYHSFAGMQAEIRAAQWQSWLVVGLITLLMYALLSRMVQWASDTIVTQRTELRSTIEQLTESLHQNEQLGERVRRAAARTTSLNERFLRRISAELHDGPAQALALALLRFDAVMETEGGGSNGAGAARLENLQMMERTLAHALQEIRTIATGLRLPELERLSVAETIMRVVRVHERSSGTEVALQLDSLPEQSTLPVKITLYRILQEALSNAFRHAGGLGQRVHVRYQHGILQMEIADEGPGMESTMAEDGQEHLGLLSMRERVESLGGHFEVTSARGAGTRIIIRLSPQAVEESLDE